MLRTSVAASGLDSGEVVSSYKALAQGERAFRAFNTDLDIRRSGTAPKTGSGSRLSSSEVLERFSDQGRHRPWSGLST